MDIDRIPRLARHIAVAASVVGALSGCDRTPEPVSPGASDLYAARGNQWDPASFPVAAEPNSEALPPQYAEIIRQVEQRGDSMFRQAPPPAVLHELELVYFAAGRIFELADRYRSVVEQQGVSHPMAARLAYLYARLGQQTAAEELARRVRDAQPEQPFAWFVYAFSFGQQESPSEETLREIERAFGKILALDPSFAMPGGISAPQIIEQRQALRERLGMPSLNGATESAAEEPSSGESRGDETPGDDSSMDNKAGEQ